jgi:hypothetical protein
MRFNPWDSNHIGNVGAAGVMAAPEDVAATAAAPRPEIGVRIMGLALVQRNGNTITVHLIDGEEMHMGEHAPRLLVPANLIDPSSTVAHTPLPSDPTIHEINLKDQSVTMPGTGGGPPDLEIEDTPIGSTIPTSEPGWGSIRHSAHLGVLCNANQITDTSKFYASVQIKHGRLRGTRPESALGAITLWTFKHPDTGQPVTPQQAVTDVLVCKTRLASSTPAFKIGNANLNFVPGISGVVTVVNLPTDTRPGKCPNGEVVCAEHLHAYYDLVNASVKPIAVGVPAAPPPQADPNYCPPGFI